MTSTLLDAVGTMVEVDPALEEVRLVAVGTTVVTDGREGRLGKGVMVGLPVLKSSGRNDVGYGLGRISADEAFGNVATSEYVGTTRVEVVWGDRDWLANGPGTDDRSKPEPKPAPPVPAAIHPLISSTTAVIRTRDTPLSMLASAVQQLVPRDTRVINNS